MELVRIQKDQVIAKRKDKVKEWYLIQDGAVVQKAAFVEMTLGKNAIIGIFESDRFLCDYVASRDTVLAVFPCEGSEDLKKILIGQEKLRRIFLKAAIEQRHQMLCVYADLQMKTKQFHIFIETIYNEYKNICGIYDLDEQVFNRIEYFQALEMTHRAENWEVNNSVALVKNYMDEYLQLMEKDDSLCVGAIMEASAQMRRVTQGIAEMVNYFLYNKDILLSDSQNDLFQLFFELAKKAANRKKDIAPIQKDIKLITEFVQKLHVFDIQTLAERLTEYQGYDFETVIANAVEMPSSASQGDEDVETADCIETILKYAEYKEDEIEAIKSKIRAYCDLPDMLSSDDDAYKLRRSLAPIYYEAYSKAFLHAMKDEYEPTPIVQMFLNFGFMDVQLAGEENANALYDLTEHLELCRSEHIYTMYEWLKAIYNGQKEPSKNEFDMDFTQYLADQRKTGKITQDQVKELQQDQVAKVKFEIGNMFTSGNRATYGKISTFCPLLGEYDLINSVDKMLVTAEKIEDVLNKVRKIDFSVFYRETLFTDPEKDINREMIMKEVLPDIILMPNAGTKAMMWQETAGVRRDTPGRFMFPIFTAVDLEDMMVETVGRFRWEICRKIQGVRWNDIREKSLTAEYCDYIQFYRKNHDLSTDAKEKVKNSLVRAKNNYREVFVKDYQSWIKYESKGSFRLNKVAREILVQYCPFTKDVRTELKANPMYTSSISRYEIQNAKKAQRIVGVYEKYKKAGGEITKELRDNLHFYQM